MIAEMFTIRLFILLVMLFITIGHVNSVIPVVDLSMTSFDDDANIGDLFCSLNYDTVKQIDEACKHVGFFFVENHGVSRNLLNDLHSVSQQFFALPVPEKRTIDMTSGGKAWRGYFGVGDEVTSGIPDQKEGIYYGTELNSNHPLPLHGANLWLDTPLGVEMKEVVLEYMLQVKLLGQRLMRLISCSAMSSEQDLHSFHRQFQTPTELFRIFNYPPHNQSFPENSMAVGEHTDYGYLTILWQDGSGGLQVRNLSDHAWIDVPTIPNTFVINLGDALEHLTDGVYRATPHRVLQRSAASTGRISFPYFFDPSFDAQLTKIQIKDSHDAKILSSAENARRRWDKADPRQFSGTYGNYLLRKVSKAFPELFAQVVSSDFDIPNDVDRESIGVVNEL